MKKWEKVKFNKRTCWKKMIYHDWFTVVDGWGTSDDEKYKYRVEITAYKVFSFRDGFSYQIKAPNIVVNAGKLSEAITSVIRYWHEGGICCYFRLEDELMSSGLWRKVGS